MYHCDSPVFLVAHFSNHNHIIPHFRFKAVSYPNDTRFFLGFGFSDGSVSVISEVEDLDLCFRCLRSESLVSS